MELIRFYYATSTDMAHLLFSGKFQDDLNSIINPEKSYFEEVDQHCYLRLRKNYSDEDAKIIGRILHSGPAEHWAKMIRDSLKKNSNHPAPECGFPFEGLTDLMVRGVWLEARNRRWFLALELLSCSAPFPYKSLTPDRDNLNTQPLIDDGRKIIEQTRIVVKENPPTIEEIVGLPLESLEAPTNNVGIFRITMPTERFTGLNNVEIIDPMKYIWRTKERKVIKLQAVSIQGTTTGAGAESGSAHAPVSFETNFSRPVSPDIDLEKFRTAIGLLDTYTGVSAYVRSAREIIAFIPLTENRHHRQWSYLDSPTRRKRRVLVGDILFDDNNLSLIDFEMRQGEHHSLGIVSTNRRGFLRDEEIRTILHKLALQKGNWENVRSNFPGVYVDKMRHALTTAADFAGAIFRKISGPIK
jgi:hypothetical protein